MNYHIAIALTSSILAGVFGQFSANLGMLGWIGFASWACFFAAGGGIKGAQKTIVTNIFGVIIGCSAVYIASITGMNNPMLLPLIGGVFIMCAAGYLILCTGLIYRLRCISRFRSSCARIYSISDCWHCFRFYCGTWSIADHQGEKIIVP